MGYRILIVEDEEEISDGIRIFLSYHDYETCQSFSGEEAIRGFEVFKPHIILLDTLLPDTRGTELCQVFRKDKSIGIIFLTALSSKQNIVEGFERGADDYITKPFDLDILLARVEALTKRLKPISSEYDKNTILNFNLYKNDVCYNKKYVGLTQTEFRVLHYLNSYEGFLTAEDILEHIYEASYSGMPSRTISVHIAKIRKKLVNAGICSIEIIAKYKIGYKLVYNKNKLIGGSQ